MSSSSSSSVRLNAFGVSSLVTASYFAFYTAYDKKTKKLKLSNLRDLVTVNRGWDWSLVEANKAISLSGLTLFMTSYLPVLDERTSAYVLFHSMTMLWAHSAYSMYKFYGNSLKKLMKEKTVKKISVALGMAGQLSLSAGYWGYISKQALVLSSTLLGLGHFYSMEIDYKGVLQVRPYAYLPFGLAIPVFGYFGWGMNKRV